jgi:outer membrane protein assembly factor BamB
LFRRTNPWPLVMAVLLLLCVSASAAQLAIPDFSFAQASDDHNEPLAPITISEFENPQPIMLEPYKVTALPVSFVIDTGDITEFGGHAAFEKHMSFYSNVKIPEYIAVGNHDGTWRSLTYEIRQLFGSTYYSFDKSGCHFVILNSAGFQHPLPSITPEQLVWLKKDLEKTGKDVPVFIGLHHPLEGKEFASPYDVDRLLDVIRPYNVMVIMCGHSHSAIHSVYKGLDMVQGGTTGGPVGFPAGYQVYSIVGGILRVAYKDQGKPVATKAMFEKPLAPPAKRYPAIKIDSPREGSTYSAQLPVKAWIAAGKGEIKIASLDIDGSKEGIDLALKSGGSFECSVPLDGLSAGAHSMKLTFTGQDGAAYDRSTFFYVESTKPKVRWRVFMNTASKTTPTVGNNMIYVGGYDGTVRAYTDSGKFRWQYQTGGAIAGQILLAGDKVYVGSEDKFLYCLSAANGARVWKFEAEEPIYSSPVSDGKAIYFGCGSGAFYGVDIVTGKQIWKNSDATYNIEIKPFLSDGKVYYGAWDTFIYCVNTADGKLVWKHVGQGSSHGGGARYYSPADCGPVVCKGVVFTADRRYECSLSNSETGSVNSFLTSVAAVALSADGQYVYLRKFDSKLEKMDSTGKVIWSVDVPAGMVPAAPTEVGGTVYVCGNRGTVSAVSASDGKVLWQYDSTPSLYVLAGVGASDSTAYVVGVDGSLTALGE